jgi:energy-coupling factor transporter transmembrane protein EcfT
MTPSGADTVAGGISKVRRPSDAPPLYARIRAALSGGDVSVTCFVFSLIVAVVCRGWALAAALACCLALAGLVYPDGLGVLARRRTWVLLAMIAVSSTLVGPDPVWTVGPLGVSVHGALLGANMIMRALIIIVAVTGLVSSVPIDRIGAFLERLGLRGLGFAVGVAFNLLPLIERSLVTSWQAMRLRAGLRRPLAAARLMLVAAVTSCLRCADEVVLAAEARAFDPSSRRGTRFAWRRRIVPLSAALAAIAAALVWMTP